MQMTCTHCGHKYTGSIRQCSAGWCGTCPTCGAAFRVNVPKGRIVVYFADDQHRECFTESYRRGNAVSGVYAFYYYHEFLAWWECMRDTPDSQWYWVFADGRCICSGAVSPKDLSKFEAHFVHQAPIPLRDRPEFIGQIIDVFEDFLTDKGVHIANEDREAAITEGEDPEGLAILFGSDYGDISNQLTEVLRRWGVSFTLNGGTN